MIDENAPKERTVIFCMFLKTLEAPFPGLIVTCLLLYLNLVTGRGQSVQILKKCQKITQSIIQDHHLHDQSMVVEEDTRDKRTGVGHGKGHETEIKDTLTVTMRLTIVTPH